MKLALALAASAALVATAAAAAPSNYRIVDRIAGPDGYWDFLRVDAANNRLIIARGLSVMTMDLKTHAITPSLTTGKHLHDALPIPGGDELLVTDGGADTASFVNGKTGAAIAQVKTGKGPDAAAYDAKSGLALVMAHVGGQVALIDAKTHRAVGSVEVGGALEMAAVDGAGHAFVNVENRNQIAVIDLGARKVTARYALPGCDGPTGLAFDAARGWLIAACDGSTDIVEAADGKLVATLHTGKEADGVALDAGRRLAFVPGREGSLSVISLAGAKPAVVSVARTEPGSKTLTVDPRDGRVYVPTVNATPAAAAGKPPTPVPGTFRILVVGK